LDREEFELIAMITQNIWHQRNRVVFGGTVMSSRCLLTSVKETLKEFRKAQAHHISSNRSSPSKQTEWSKPPLNWIKLNWDAAVDQTTKMIGWGLIARDHKGKVWGSLDSVVAEAIAAIGVEFCSEMGFSTIVREGDA
jgi:hypothetical protein